MTKHKPIYHARKPMKGLGETSSFHRLTYLERDKSVYIWLLLHCVYIMFLMYIYDQRCALCAFYVTVDRRPHCIVSINFFFLFVLIPVKCPGKQFFSHVGTEPPIPGYYQYFWGVKGLLLKETTHRPGRGSNRSPDPESDALTTRLCLSKRCS